MKKLLLILAISIISISSKGQNDSKLGWFINPEVGAIFHSDHLGYTLGGNFGVKLLRDRLKVGCYIYGRPGPINSGQQYEVTPVNGQTYKGKSTLMVTADHGTSGVSIAPIFHFNKVRLELPFIVGQMGAGYYLTGDDRNTPDGDRVSVWEDRLMDGRDAGFSIFYEAGARLFVPLKHPNLSAGIGLHYSMMPGWEAYVDPSGDMYNNRFRLSIAIGFESAKK